MKKYSKFLRVSILLIVLYMVSPSVLPYTNVLTVQAAAKSNTKQTTVKISKKTLALEVGKAATLKVSGTKSKVTWATSNKAVVTVSKTGKVTAKKAGTATITATVNKKKYTCKVTVTEAAASNSYVTNAPFTAQENTYSKISYVVPKDWVKTVLAEQDKAIVLLYYPSAADTTKGTSNVTITIKETGIKKGDYSISKAYFEGLITQDYITAQLAQKDPSATVSDFKTSDYETKLGTAFKTDYKAVFSGISMTQTIYDLIIDNIIVEVNVTNIGDSVTPDVSTVGEYLLNSIQAAE